jgi:hypothetical protein
MLASILLVAFGEAATPAQVADVGSKTDRSQPIRLDRGPIPVERAFALKRAMGATAFAAEVDAAIDRLKERTEMTDRCASPAETAAAAQLELVRRTPDPQTLAKSRIQAEAALSERRTLRAIYLGGEKAPFPYGVVSRFAARAKTEPHPRLAELYRRMAEDQFANIDSVALRQFLGPGVHTTWEKGLDDAALAYVDATIESEGCPIKLANTAWLKSDLRDHGWYRISIYGADADRAAWLIVQHARHDLPFQEEVVAILEPLWQSGETKGENFAMLYDQTAHYHKRPGRFGVWGDCTAPGVWTPAPLDDRGATDEWRAKAGMPPFAQYIATQSRGCVD